MSGEPVSDEVEGGERGASLGDRAFSGVLWTSGAQSFNTALRFGLGILLARLLAPSEFGLMAMAGVFLGFAGLYAEAGLGAAVVQRRDLSEGQLSSLYWFNLLAGAVVAALVALAAPLIAYLYDEPALTLLVAWLAVDFVLRAAGNIHHALLQKRLDFRRLAITELLAVVVSGGVGVALALRGAGVWSLVAQSVVWNIVRTVVLWRFSGWRPLWRLARSDVRDVLAFSSPLLAYRAVNYWARQADDFLLGKYAGAAPLGHYARAYTLMTFPLSSLTSVISRVLFPALSSIQDDDERLARIYRKVIGAVALLAFPIMTGLWVTADAFVHVVYGAKWAAMVPLLQVFCGVGMLQSVLAFNGDLYLAKGRTSLQLRVGLVVSAVTLVAFVAGLRGGALGVAYAYAAANVLLAYPTLRIAVGLIGLGPRDVVRELASVASCTAVMGAVVYGLGLVLPSGVPQWGVLLLQVVSGALVYGALVHVFRLRPYLELRELVTRGWRRRREAS